MAKRESFNLLFIGITSPIVITALFLPSPRKTVPPLGPPPSKRLPFFNTAKAGPRSPLSALVTVFEIFIV